MQGKRFKVLRVKNIMFSTFSAVLEPNPSSLSLLIITATRNKFNITRNLTTLQQCKINIIYSFGDRVTVVLLQYVNYSNRLLNNKGYWGDNFNFTTSYNVMLIIPK